MNRYFNELISSEQKCNNLEGQEHPTLLSPSDDLTLP